MVDLFAECCLEPVDGDRVLAAIHIEHVVLVVDLKDLERPIVGGAAADHKERHGGRTHSQWKPGCQACKPSDRRGAHVQVAGQSACCLEAGGGTQEMLARSVARERETPRGYGGKCRIRDLRQSGRGLSARMS